MVKVQYRMQLHKGILFFVKDVKMFENITVESAVRFILLLLFKIHTSRTVKVERELLSGFLN